MLSLVPLCRPAFFILGHRQKHARQAHRVQQQSTCTCHRAARGLSADATAVAWPAPPLHAASASIPHPALLAQLFSELCFRGRFVLATVATTQGFLQLVDVSLAPDEQPGLLAQRLRVDVQNSLAVPVDGLAPRLLDDEGQGRRLSEHGEAAGAVTAVLVPARVGVGTAPDASLRLFFFW